MNLLNGSCVVYSTWPSLLLWVVGFSVGHVIACWLALAIKALWRRMHREPSLSERAERLLRGMADDLAVKREAGQ